MKELSDIKPDFDKLISHVRRLLTNDLSERQRQITGHEVEQLLRELEVQNEKFRTLQNARRQTRKELQQELDFRHSIEDIILSGICVSDMDGCLIYANPTFCDMFGFQKHELLHRYPPYPFWPEEEEDSEMALFHELADESESLGDEIRQYCKKDGETLWGLNTKAMLKDPDGKNIGILISINDVTRRVQAEKKLLRSRQALRRLAAKVIDSQEQERKRIAKELHDSVGSSLTGVRFAIEQKMQEIGAARCEKEVCLEPILNMLRHITQETRRISKNLHPDILDHVGIRIALQSHCAQFQDIYTGITVDCRTDLNEETLSGERRLLIFRIVQEALNNTAKHSHADKVDVCLEERDQKIVLCIEDNGRGFDMKRFDDEDPENTGMGLESMRERALYSGGTFEIRSATGQGTRVLATWPVIGSGRHGSGPADSFSRKVRTTRSISSREVSSLERK